jgi:hypothetical protein
MLGFFSVRVRASRVKGEVRAQFRDRFGLMV